MSEVGIKLDLPPEQAERLRAQVALKLKRGSNEDRWATDPWAFLCEAVWTLDQRGEGGGVRPYPGNLLLDPGVVCGIHGKICVNYLHCVVQAWMVEPRFLIAKSRRLIVSWTMVALHYWRARYNPARMIAFGSRKQGQTEEEGSAELIKRVKFIHDHLPADAAPRTIKYGFARFAFTDSDSTIVGVAQGADQARQYTFSDYFADEFAFWERAAETYASLLPTLEGGGTFTGVSSASPGFMEMLVYDSWQTAV